jgi:heme exporter protein B
VSQLSTPRACAALLQRDLLLAFRRRAEIANPLLFYVLVCALFAIGAGADVQLLREIGPGVVWVAALLATLLSLDAIFRSDFDDGTLEQLLLSAHPVWLLVLVKTLGHWIVSGLPLLIVAPLLAQFMQLPGGGLGVLLMTLLLGTPTLSLIGAIGVALTVGLRRGGIILSLLVLPLYVPVLIFATDAVHTALGGIPVTAQLLFLSAMLTFAAALAPIATAAALRVSLS